MSIRKMMAANNNLIYSYKIFFHEIYFPHSTFRVSSKVHMSHYLSLSLSGTGWEVLFLSTGSYILWRTFSRNSVSVILKPQVFNLKLVTQQIEMFLPQKITDPEIVAILQDGWLRCKEFSTPSNSFYPSSSGQSNSGARLLTSAASPAPGSWGRISDARREIHHSIYFHKVIHI